MTLIDAVLQRTGCGTVQELPAIPAEMRKRLALSIDKLDAVRIPLNDWNTLIVSFGGKPAAAQEEAKRRLMISLLTSGQPSPTPAPQKTAQPQRTPPAPAKVPAETAGPAPKPTSALRKLWNAFTTAVVLLAVALAVVLVGVRLTGLQVFSVLSGSMEPVYRVGALIYVRSIAPEDLRVGDDITFLLDEDTIATHRIIEILPDEEDPTVLRFRTQGVANSSPDGSPVHYKNVVGKPVFTIPYLGYAANYIQNPPGTYVTLAGAAVFLLLVFLPDLFAEDEPEQADKKDDKKKKPAGEKKPRG